MAQFPYSNPSSPIISNGAASLPESSVNATHFDSYGVGGYQEVYNLSDLLFTIPSNTYGKILYSGNTIPINFYKGSGTSYSYNTLVLNSDNISSGRRKLGMLVYVYETDQIYQFKINNYDNLWSAATASTGTFVIGDFGTIVQGNSSENNLFISAWTSNAIEGVSGATSSTAVWKKLTTGGGGGGSGITGGTFNINTGDLDLNSTGGTITIPGFLYGSGTTNTIPKYQTSDGFTGSQIFDNGTSVGFGTYSPNSSAILELSATTKGFLPPRMTEAQRTSISSPALGLMVYQTDGSDGVYVYKAAGWIQMIWYFLLFICKIIFLKFYNVRYFKPVNKG